MSRGLTRFHESKQPHVSTFSCYHRQASLTSPEAKNIFVAALERVRRTYGLRVFAYVVMPEHVHLLLSEPQRDTLADAIKSLKQGVSRRLIGKEEHFWHKRYYDLNVWDHDQLVEKPRDSKTRDAVTRGRGTQVDATPRGGDPEQH